MPPEDRPHMTTSPPQVVRLAPAGLLRFGMAVLAVGVGAAGHLQTAFGIALAAGVSLLMREFATPGVDLATALVLAAHALGSAAGLPARVAVWDTTFHVLVAALIAIALGAMLPPLRLPGMLLLTGLGMAVGLEWEALEYLVDLVAGTSYAPSAADTALDLAGDALGIVVGLAFLRAADRAGHPMPAPRFLEDGY